MKIIGIRPSSFTGSNGETISGKNFYFTYPLDTGDGCGCERAYLTDAKLSQLEFVPQVGDEVVLDYNRFGKPSGMRLVIV